jgi:hypothetical protein
MTLVALGLMAVWFLLPVSPAQAVPSFARQTGQECTACHTIFPELTPFGRNFKITGYTASKNADKPYEWPPPISAHMIWSFTNINKTLPPNVAFGLDGVGKTRGNDNVNIPQEMSLFWAGRFFPYAGGFVQGTYDGVANRFVLDHTDIRFAYPAKVCDKPLVLGLTVNNGPTVQDVLNTTAFGFPWTSSAVNLTPGAATVLDGGLDSVVGGAGAYFFWNNLLYGEFTVYRTARDGISQPLGAGSVTDPMVNGAVPYWRVFLQHQWQQHSLAVGTFGLISNIFPGGKPVASPPASPNLTTTRGLSDRFVDVAFDAQYQYITNKHIFTAQTLYIHEDQRWNASFARGDTANDHNWLDTYKINLNYYYRTANWGTVGGTVAYFSTWGSQDTGLYAPSPGDGSRTGKPNSDGFILEASYLPWKYTKVTVQYTIFNRFNGARKNYDFNPGEANILNRRNGSDNNTLFIAFWSAI